MRALIKKAMKAMSLVLTPRFFRALFSGVAAGIEHRNILRASRSQTIVDIGANRGQFALIARECNKGARIIAFEPLAGPAELFEKIFASDRNIVLHRTAIGATQGNAVIHISRKDDSSSLYPITGRQDMLFPGTRERATAEIAVNRLGAYLSASDIISPAMLKIDVQGYELEVLRGCEELLDRFEQIYVECSFVELYEGQALVSEVVDFLYHRGRSLKGIYNVTYDKTGVAIQGDFLFGGRNNKS